MLPLPIVFGASLPNDHLVEIDFIEQLEENWVSPDIVHSLTQTGEIIIDGDQVFVEFHKMTAQGMYFDGAWCNIGTMGSTCILLGKDWLEERHAAIALDRRTCTLQPPHLKANFLFANAHKLLFSPPSKEVSPTRDSQFSSDMALNTQAQEDVSPTVEVSAITVQPSVVVLDQWDHNIFLESGLHHISKDLFEYDIVGAPLFMAAGACDQDILLTSGLHQISDDLFDAQETFTVVHDVVDNVSCVMAPPTVDFLWADFIESSLQSFWPTKREVLQMFTIIQPQFPLAQVMVPWILPHFKTRGRVFSNQGRMMGIQRRMDPRLVAYTRRSRVRRTEFICFIVLFQIKVHGGSSGIGTFAIQIAKHLGVRVFVTAGSAEKLAFCKDLGADVCINYKTEDFVARVKEETAGKGVDVILDNVGGPYLQRNLASLSLDGRLFIIGFQGGAVTEVNLGPLLARRLTVQAAGLRNRSIENKVRIVAEVEKHVWPAIATGKVKPVIYKTFPLSEAAEAHKLMESSLHIGKILLVP